jgi:hypothetical protein
MRVSWVDDGMILAPPVLVEKVQEQLERAFMCKCEWTLIENIDSKIAMSCDDTGLGAVVQFMQPILI